ncbi:MAG: SH3 domain-containing protein [Cytophagales bacterium]|nr:MAG: SH3 domain-containing protein [Cytophagales bacterium]TAF62567.1 MAG: SH3 domain-containing protein [Cytophagales bacterium]
MRKYFLIFLSLLLSFSLAEAKDFDKELVEADKLFEQKKFTEAFKRYETLLTSESYSPQMLLKMAFIKEGLADYASALYFLNLYYRYNSDSDVLQKMVEISDKYELKGYDYSDLDYFIALYNQLKWIVCTLVVLLSVYFLSSAFKSKEKRVAQNWLFAQVVLLALFVGIHNFAVLEPTGIIRSSQVYAMRAPSAAASVHSVLGKGHRIRILEEKDIWYKVLWEGEISYVRKHHLLVVR